MSRNAATDDRRKPSLLEAEIREQPRVLERFLQEEIASVARIAQELRRRDIDYIMIAARGTSDNAATYGKYLFATMNRLPVALAAPSLFTLYHQPPRLSRALVIGISQSGASPDIVAVIEEGRRQVAATLAITNVPDAPLAQTAEHVILCHAGEERSVAATKTYTAQLMALALLSASMAGHQPHLAQLQEVPNAVERTLHLAEDLQDYAVHYRDMERCVVIGRGYNYATAFEIALKLKELTYVLADPYSSADFLHGPIALVEEGFPAIIVAPSGQVYDDLQQLAVQLRERGANLMIISDREDMLAWAQTPVRLPVAVEEWLSPLVCVLPGQVLAKHLAIARGIDPDRPRGLQKVTKTL